MDRNKLVTLLAQCSDSDSETDLHRALVEAFAVTEDEIEAAAPGTATQAAASACC